MNVTRQVTISEHLPDEPGIVHCEFKNFAIGSGFWTDVSNLQPVDGWKVGMVVRPVGVEDDSGVSETGLVQMDESFIQGRGGQNDFPMEQSFFQDARGLASIGPQDSHIFPKAPRKRTSSMEVHDGGYRARRYVIRRKSDSDNPDNTKEKRAELVAAMDALHFDKVEKIVTADEHLKDLHRLLDERCYFEIDGESWRTWPLMYLARSDHGNDEETGYQLFRILLKAKADPRVKDEHNEKRTVIDWAYISGNDRIVNKLRACGVHVNSKYTDPYKSDSSSAICKKLVRTVMTSHFKFVFSF